MLTIHRSKGLEFPIVYCPSCGTDPAYDRGNDPPVYHDDHGARDDRRRPQGPRHRAHAGARREERRRGPAPRLRRADPRAAPGGRLVGGHLRHPRFAAEAAAVRPRRGWRRRPRGRDTPSDDEVAARFRHDSARRRQDLASSGSSRRRRRLAPPASPRPTSTTAARSTAIIDARWRRTSYSGLDRRRPRSPVASEPERGRDDDERRRAPTAPRRSLDPTPRRRCATSRRSLATMRGGAASAPRPRRARGAPTSRPPTSTPSCGRR